jgi:hypothetical protein
VQPPSTSKLSYFFSDHHRWLLQHIQRRLRNHADAEDTAADTFCQMLVARVDVSLKNHRRSRLAGDGDLSGDTCVDLTTAIAGKPAPTGDLRRL